MQSDQQCLCGLDKRWKVEGTGGLKPDEIERVESTGRVHRVVPKKGPSFLHICGSVGTSSARAWVDEQSQESIDGCDEGLLVMDEFDDCIVGIAERFHDKFVVYDRDKVLARMMEKGLSEEEAVEHFYFNTVGAWVGAATPAFITFPPSGAD
jgi:hypothetical protein